MAIIGITARVVQCIVHHLWPHFGSGWLFILKMTFFSFQFRNLVKIIPQKWFWVLFWSWIGTLKKWKLLKKYDLDPRSRWFQFYGTDPISFRFSFCNIIGIDFLRPKCIYQTLKFSLNFYFSEYPSLPKKTFSFWPNFLILSKILCVIIPPAAYASALWDYIS